MGAARLGGGCSSEGIGGDGDSGEDAVPAQEAEIPAYPDLTLAPAHTFLLLWVLH